MKLYRGPDSLRVLYTGGVSNRLPEDSLGGVASQYQVKWWAHEINNIIPAIRIDYIFPANGEGNGSLVVIDGLLYYTPPGGGQGEGLWIADGETRVIAGSDLNKALIVTRTAGFAFEGLMTFEIYPSYNGLAAMNDLTSAQRVAGYTSYRAAYLKNVSPFTVSDIKIWTPTDSLTPRQSVYSLGTEDPSSGTEEIQTIPDEATAPSGVSFDVYESEFDALEIASLLPGEGVGLWLEKEFPSAGIVNPAEFVIIAFQHKGE